MIAVTAAWVLLVNVCVVGVCFHHPPERGWLSKEACLLPVDAIIEQAETKLERDPLMADEEHHFSWACVTDEELRHGGYKFTHRKTLGGKRI